jgi:hypothetical protein
MVWCRAICAVVSWSWAVGCTGIEPLSADEIARRLPRAPAAVRAQLEVDVESDTLRGTFTGLLVARPSPPAVRFQLLPEMGTPILDVAATPRAIQGAWHGDAIVTWHGATTDPALSPLLLFGITLLEVHAEVTPSRVRGGAGAGLAVRGCFPGVESVVAARGQDAVDCELRRGYVRWRAWRNGDAGAVDAPGFRLRARVLEREAASDLADDVFDLAHAQ